MITRDALQSHFDAFLTAMRAGDTEAALDEFRAYDYPRQEAWWDHQPAAMAGLSADVEIVNRTQFADWAKDYRGEAGLFALMDEITENTRHSRFQSERIDREGDRVAVLGTLRAVARHTGLEFDVPWANVLTIPDREVTRVEMFTDHDAALAALQESSEPQR